jgi:hypothetical protein
MYYEYKLINVKSKNPGTAHLIEANGLWFGAWIRLLSSRWTVQLDYFVCSFVKAYKLLIVGVMGIAKIDLTWIRRSGVCAMQYECYIGIAV